MSEVAVLLVGQPDYNGKLEIEAQLRLPGGREIVLKGDPDYQSIDMDEYHEIVQAAYDRNLSIKLAGVDPR